VVTASVDGWSVGLSVCYDLRFPELYQAMRFPGQAGQAVGVAVGGAGGAVGAVGAKGGAAVGGDVGAVGAVEAVGAVAAIGAVITAPVDSVDPRGVEMILVPSAFACKTGAAHWEVLLRARAIETQCYVIAAAQSGKFLFGLHIYAHTFMRSWVNASVTFS
jgi:predicted amidohydrolase